MIQIRRVKRLHSIGYFAKWLGAFFLAIAPRPALSQNSLHVLQMPDLAPPPTLQANPEPAPSYNRDFEKIDALLNNKQFADDGKLSDLRLRAEDGSLSRYSIKANAAFAGPILSNPSAPDLPNPDHSVGNYSQTLRGSTSVKYRLDSDRAINFGTGISFNHPLQGMDRTDASNPFVSYQTARRYGPLQMLQSPMLTYTTTPELVATGQLGSVGYMATMVYELGDSRFGVALDLLSAVSFFNRGYQAGIPILSGNGFGHGRHGLGGPIGDGRVQQYRLDYGPGLHYKISDKFDCTTGLRFGVFNPRETGDMTTLWNQSPKAQLGVGYSYDRDIYIGPYLQTYPTLMSLDTTTINVQSIFSIL